MKVNWNKENTLGMLIGVFSPIVFIPIVLLILSLVTRSSFGYLWSQFIDSSEFRSKYVSLSLISNLIWFYLFLNREKYEYTKGIILGLLLYAPYMIYINVLK
jgi:hypothetical protein